jgi:ATP-dependent DNA helicase RecG
MQEFPRLEKNHSSALPLQYIKGVGPRRAQVLAEEGIVSIEDLVLYAPHSYIDRTSVGTIRSLRDQLREREYGGMSSGDGMNSLRGEVTVICSAESIQERSLRKGKSMLVVSVSDGSGVPAELVFWNYTSYYKKTITTGQLYAVSGSAEISSFGRVTFTHPEIEPLEEEDSLLYEQGRILPKYRITQAMKNAGLSMRTMRQLVEQVIDRGLHAVPETLSNSLIAKYSFPAKQSAIHALHFPSSRNELHGALRRMRFEELFFFEMSMALRHHGSRIKDSAPVIKPPSPRARALTDKLPFSLTGAQKRVIREIVSDVGSGHAMNRLLQGDVGSGKTIVAVLSMLMAADNGYQSLLLAPTEILAEQHYNTVMRYCEGTDVHVVLVSGSMTKKQREAAAEIIGRGEPTLIIGTHALFSEKKTSKAAASAGLPYKKVGLIVIDEQHRFGVMQRAKLRAMGMESFRETSTLVSSSSSSSATIPASAPAPHMLVMSATPIPRTLAMTAYGDLDVSIIDERPANRQPIFTGIAFESTLAKHYAFMRDEIAKGRQCYIVYPLVEQSEKLDLKAATEAFTELSEGALKGLRCGLLHGQMSWSEKESVMHAFLRHEFDVLIATTVIEVGVDVPNATVMLIQHAERFGLSQLHQLRGRVGRGAHQSYCFLATKDHFAFALRAREQNHQTRAAAVVRLRTMEQTDDGFQIAEVDLRLRGPGDVLGTRQSGLPDFRFADIVRDSSIIAEARECAFDIIAGDPQLRAVDHEPIRTEIMRRRSTDASFAETA